MSRYIVRRLFSLVGVVIFSSVVVFLMIHLIPGDAAVALAGPDAEPQVVQALREKMGLTKPLYEQYFIWAAQVLRGDLGTSYVSQFPVSKMILDRLPATLELTFAALLISVLLAIPAGVIAALKQRKVFDLAVSVVTSTGLAVPEYWSGLLAILFFTVYLHWLPPGGRIVPTVDLVGWLKSLALPALTLAFPIAAMQARFVRTTMIEVMNEPYIMVARGKGLGSRRIVMTHALRNGLIPLITVVAIQMGRLLGGAILVESIYNWPGIGRLMVVAITQRDYSLVQATVLCMVILFSLINLLTDLFYGLIDPRIRVAE